MHSNKAFHLKTFKVMKTKKSLKSVMKDVLKELNTITAFYTDKKCNRVRVRVMDTPFLAYYSASYYKKCFRKVFLRNPRILEYV